ncbi:MAG: exodeoxyribonuclease V subunit alpha [Gammaproteobacteria bacterium]
MTSQAKATRVQNASMMIALLENWVERDWLRAVDLALTRFLWDESQDATPELLLAIALTSHQLGRGHVCLDLQATLADPYMALSLPPDQYLYEETKTVSLPADLLEGLPLQDWAAGIRGSELVGDDHGKTPLVFDGRRLYLRRYWHYERTVESAINHRLALGQQIRQQMPHDQLRQYLSELFPSKPDEETNWQKVACALAAGSAFSIITGGPGTGKTTTVVKLLALLQGIALAQNADRPLQIRLAAPTGKAAARLKESISNKINELPALLIYQGLTEAIPADVITLHRLLGSRPNSRQFKHDARNPLVLDVLVVDEASMVDLEMMAAVLSAMPQHARLVLLGDKDQLASVEAGSVLGQLCSRANEGHFTSDTAAWLKTVSAETIDGSLIDEHGLALDQHIVMLRKSHRFTSASGIGQLAKAVNVGLPPEIDMVWRGAYPDLAKLDLGSLTDTALESLLIGPDKDKKGYGHYLSLLKQRPPLDADLKAFNRWADRILAAHSQFQLLCALRNGPFGVNGLNQQIADILYRRGLIRTASTWYEGRPVLVTKNDYRLGLMNGDIGIALSFPHRDKQSGELSWVLRVAFPRDDGGDDIHWVLPSRLLSVETVFAMTVHKAQGSEFDHCALILPPKRNPVTTRELVYTGITRAKNWFTLVNVDNAKAMRDASSRTVIRSGGLFLTSSE